MSTMLALLVIVLPVFLLVGMGYGAVRTGVFPDRAVDGLIRFATHVAVPVLLFRALYTLDFGAALRLWHLVSFYAAATACFVLAILAARLGWGRRPGEAVALAFSALFSNSVLLGVPIIDRAYGAEVLEPGYAIIAFHAPFCYLLGILTMEFARRDGAGAGTALRRSAAAMFRNAMTAGIALGAALNLAGVALPAPLMAAVEMLADAALPVALFGLGGVLTRYALRAEMGEAAMIAALSLVVHPGLAWLLTAQLLALPEPFVRAAVLIAAMPPGVNGYVFAAMYGRSEGAAASSILLATGLSVLSVTVWLWVLGGAAIG